MGIIDGWTLPLPEIRVPTDLTGRVGAWERERRFRPFCAAISVACKTAPELSVDPRGSSLDVAKPGRVRKPGAAFPRIHGHVV